MIDSDAAIPSVQRKKQWLSRLLPYINRAESQQEIVIEGQLARMVGLTLEAVGCRAAIGSLCKIESKAGSYIEAEVVGFSGERIFLMPTGNPHVLEPGCRVIPLGKNSLIKVGFGLLGCVLDGSGKALDKKGALD